MAKVKSVESSKEFLDLIEKSSLLGADKLETARQVCGATEDPKTAARQLLKDGLLTNWQATQLLGGFAALTIGNYKLLDQIGKGELGRVYLAEHAKMGHKVALKALASKSAGDPKLVERFLKEAQVAGAFEHQNVLRVLDVASNQDRPYVVTEFVAGGDLQQRVEKSGPLPPSDAAAFVAQAAEGMAYVHGKEVLHRDLKPANLLVDDKGVVKILDVGVGQLRQADKPGNESTGELLLSALGYMSPEQIRGKDLDRRSDIYALGGTLYFVLTGRVPFTAINNEERDIIKSTKRPVPVTTLKPDIPAELAAICDQMMALKASDRPASMDEVAQRLRQFIQGSAAVPVPEVAIEVASDGTLSSDTVHQIGADTVRVSDSISGQINEAFVENNPFVENPAVENTTFANTTFENTAVEDPAAKNTAAKNTAVKSHGVVPDLSDQAAASEPVKIDLGLADAAPSSEDVAMDGFKIQRKKKAAEEVPTTTDSDESPLAAVAKKRAHQQRMLLMGIGGAAVLVLTLGIVAWMMLSHGGSPEVAQNTDKKDSEAGISADSTAAATGGLEPAAPESVPDPTKASNTPAAEATPALPASVGIPAALSGTSPPGATSTNPVATPAATPAPSTTTTPGASPAAGATTPATTPAATPATSSPAPVTTPPTAVATPAPTTAPAATPATPAAAAKKEEPKKDAPKKEEPKPAPPKEEPKPQPPKSGKTFEIATAVDLPRLPSADAAAPAEAPMKVLGRINIDPQGTCFLAMFGGEKAMKGRNEFALRSAQGGTASRDWEVVQKDTTGTESVIATLALPAQELTFTWTPDGLKNPNAGALRNCILRITSGEEKPHLVAFRTPLKAPPIAVENLEKSAMTAKFNLESIPDVSAIRMEPSVTNQKITFDAGGPDISKGDQWIFFGETKEQAPLALKLDTSITPKGVQITALPYVLLPGEKPQRLTPALRKNIPVAELKKRADDVNRDLELFKKMKKEDQAKYQIQNDANNIAHERLESTLQRLQKLGELLQQLNGSGKIHFRIFYDTGEGHVDLVKTDESAAPAGK